MARRLRALTEEEQQTIRRLARARTAPARLVERARIVELASQGQPAAAIAKAVGLHVQTVRERLTRFNAVGLAALDDAPRPGRPATYTPAQVGEVIATALSDPRTLGLPFACWTLDRLEAYLNGARGLQIKRSRIDELLRGDGVRWQSAETWVARLLKQAAS